MMTAKELAASTTLGNWRTDPYTRWSFHNVDRLVQGEVIGASGRPDELATGPGLDLSQIALGDGRSVEDALSASYTDAFVVMHKGRIVAERYDGLMAPTDKHIIFSVSKSVTGALAGILVDEGTLDPEKPVTDYVAELAGSAWGDATVRHVLDMTVSIRFTEDYLDPLGDVSRYRVAMDWNPPGDFEYEGGLHDFFPKLPKDVHEHGHRFHYVSPNSDVLGWILEAASGRKIAELASEKVWSKLGAEADAWITVDRKGGARTAGGICVRARDLARFGEMMRNGGYANGVQIIPNAWVEDIRKNGDRQAWDNGSRLGGLFPEGSYRAQWYVPDSYPDTLIAIGIHGQWIYADAKTEVTVVKLSSQPLPEDDASDRENLAIFAAISAHFGS